MNSPAVPVSLDELVRSAAVTVPADEPLLRLGSAAALASELEAKADALVSHFVEQARDSGASWSSIGGTLGVTKQAAQQRWHGRRP
ncbi:hypothetical protein BH20ACT1_BH20ACT1_01230 [soil metagenome]